MTLKEQMQIKRQQKQQKSLEKSLKSNLNKLAKSKNNDIKNDYIPSFEFINSPYRVYLDETKQLIMKNTITTEHIVNKFTQLHRFTFLVCGSDDGVYDFSNIREIIEKYTFKALRKYPDLHKSDMARIGDLQQVHKLHWTQQDLLVQFIDVIYDVIKAFKSRQVFAFENSRMITNHKNYVMANQNIMPLADFFDWGGVEEALKIVNARVYAKHIYVNTKKHIISIANKTRH